jgi:hypothetical protein
MDKLNYQYNSNNNESANAAINSEISFLNLLREESFLSKSAIGKPLQSFKAPDIKEGGQGELNLTWIDVPWLRPNHDGNPGKAGISPRVEYYTSADDVVETLYQQLFRREPDAGAKWAVEALQSGVPYKYVVKAAIDNGLQEFKKSIPKDQAEVVPFLYMRLLNRKERPSEAEAAGWNKLLKEKGLDAVIDGILDAPEFKRNCPILRVPNDFPALAFDMVPKKFSLNNSTVKIEDNLARITKNIPAVPPVLENLAKAIDLMEVNAGEHATVVKAHGQHKFQLESPQAAGVTVTMTDPTFRITFDKNNPNKIEITDITGATTTLGKVTGMSMELTADGAGKPLLRMQVTHASESGNKPQESVPPFLDALGSGLRAVANSKKFDVPLDEATARSAQQFLAYGRKWSEVKDLFQVFSILGSQADLPLVHEALKDVANVTRSGENGEKVEILRRKAKAIDVGCGLALQFDERIHFRLAKELLDAGLAGTAIKISDVSGLGAKLPLPKLVLNQLGIPTDVRLSELSLSERQPDGTRRLTLKTSDHGSISLSLDADGHPKMRNGNLSVDVCVILHGKETPMTVTFNPQKAAEVGPKGPDFTIALRGDDKQLGEILQKVVGGNLGPADQLTKGLKEIRKQGDKVTIMREKSTSSDYAGLTLDAAEQIDLTVELKNGIVLKDVKGLSYKMAVDLGWLSDALDLGRETKPTKITQVKVTDPDSTGKQTVVIRGDGPFAAVRVDVKDGSIATDPNDENRGQIFALLRLEHTEEERKAGKSPAHIGVIVKVDANGGLKMTSREKANAAAEAAYMIANKDKFRQP